jgi:hypothetical protein
MLREDYEDEEVPVPRYICFECKRLVCHANCPYGDTTQSPSGSEDEYEDD